MHDNASEQPVRILHLEDNPHDSELVQALMDDQEVHCFMHRVESRKDFEEALDQGGWQVVLSDFSLPSFDGLAALALTLERCPGVPFILFSGTIGEEMAIESLKSGATDYVLKQRPARLVPAIRHALKEAQELRLRHRTEEELRKSEERKKQLEAQFLRVQRMESIGALAGGIAHDLNNALVPVLVGIGFLRLKPHDPDTDQMLALMESSVRRGADMVKQVLTFTRGVEGKETIIKVDMLVREMEKIFKDIFPKSIQWRVRFPDDLWPVTGSPTQLHQVLMNLCINARDAMPKGGQLTISIDNVQLAPAEAEPHGVNPGPWVVVRVSDTGTGMPQDVLDKIFQPFFTTKDPGKGTGLGLSTSMNIVQNHGGFIAVKSELGKGTTFSVHLPAVVNGRMAEVEQKTSVMPTGRGELILVVDDEAAICEITKATLENYGYQVLTASSGPEAVAVFAENRHQVKLALTDTSMPFMDGRATCLALHKLNPRLKIIAASGDDERRDDDTAFRARVAAFMTKPYTVEKLLTTVHEVLTKNE